MPKTTAHRFAFLRTPMIAVPVAVTGGTLAHAVHLPLPWVLGAMLAVAMASLLTGRSLDQARPVRRIAQGCIGLAIGLSITPATLSLLGGLLPWIVLSAAMALVLSVVSAPLIQRLAQLDGPTAIYAVALGASSEMAMQAQRAGADGAIVASAHAVRIIIVTGSITLLAWYGGAPAVATAMDLVNTRGTPTSVLSGLWLSIFAGCAAAVALTMHRLAVPNPWLLGPLLVGGLGAAITGGARLHESLLIAAQIVIGWALGQNMTRAFFFRAPRVLASAALMTIGILTACLAIGAFVSWGTGLPMMTSFLALAPGGMAEMGVIAKALGSGAPVVAAFHIVRVLCTVFMTGILMRWMLRTGWVHA